MNDTENAGVILTPNEFGELTSSLLKKYNIELKDLSVDKIYEHFKAEYGFKLLKSKGLASLFTICICF